MKPAYASPDLKVLRLLRACMSGRSEKLPNKARTWSISWPSRNLWLVLLKSSIQSPLRWIAWELNIFSIHVEVQRAM